MTRMTPQPFNMQPFWIEISSIGTSLITFGNPAHPDGLDTDAFHPVLHSCFLDGGQHPCFGPPENRGFLRAQFFEMQVRTGMMNGTMKTATKTATKTAMGTTLRTK
jgi:hypothetical protein